MILFKEMRYETMVFITEKNINGKTIEVWQGKNGTIYYINK